MSRLERLACIALVVILLLITAIGCTKSTSGQNEANKTSDQSKSKNVKVKEVSYWIIDWGGEMNNLTKKVIEEFNSKHPDIKVKLYPTAPTEGTKLTIYDDKFLPAVAAGTPPDIIMCGAPSALVENDILEDLTPYIEKYKVDMDMYYPFKKSDVEYKGKYYALPYEITVEGVLLYNKTMFKKAGLDPNYPPASIAELDTAAEKMFKTNEQGEYTQVGFIPWEWLIKHSRCLVAPFGGKLFDGNGNPTPTDPNNIKAFEWANKYAQKYGFAKVNKYISSLQIPIVPFRFGGVGMIYAYNGQVNEQIKQNSSFEWDVAPFPSVSGEVAATVGGGWNVAIPKGSKQKEAAFEFLKYYTGKKGQMQLYKNFSTGLLYGYSAIPEVNKAYRDTMHPAQQVFVDVIMDSIKPVKNVYLPSEYGVMMDQAVDDMLAGKGEPRQLLADVEKKIKAAMNK